MGPFVDMHSHTLAGVDDGAFSFEDSCAMVDASYADGVRVLFFTPHFHPGLFGDNREESLKAFQELCAYAKQKYPKMALRLANELYYSRDCVSWLDQGLCRPIVGRFVLVDFSYRAERKVIMNGLSRMLAGGYVPILAHPERYEKLSFGLGELQELRDNGVLLQMDAQSPLGGFGLNVRMRAATMLRKGLVDFVGSDAHGLGSRPPQLSQAFQHIEKRYGHPYARAIFYDNAVKLLRMYSSEKKVD